MKRLLIAGTGSGLGKTTVTCAILSALKLRGINPTAFKCGPDYIDPMFHRSISGIRAYNLDPFFLDGAGLRSHLASRGREVSVIEGAMGYYDGIVATDTASTYSVARETRTPAVLVVSARGVGASLQAVIEGFTRHRPDSQIKGVIFNDAEESRYPDLRQMAIDAGIRAYGTLPRKEKWALPSRHLGLLIAGEISGLKDTLAELGRQAERTLDVDGLLTLAETAPPLSESMSLPPRRIHNVRLAVAKDEAFCFMYEENLELPRNLGCDLVFFSPLRDSKLPDGISGLYLCGGYPELYVKTLSENISMRDGIRRAVKNGLPTIAECGGFMFLCETLDGLPMCGVIPGAAYKTEKLQRFGYVTLTACRNNLLCKTGESIRAHEFHYWDSASPGDGFTAKKAGRGISYPCVYTTDSLYAGFPHLYLPANPSFAENFVKRMSEIEGKGGAL
jgi:cobyrinic acid a,c-diamide synthase